MEPERVRRLLKRARVRAEPYAYQLDGIRWWARREHARRHTGGVLADDKGLGKTMQCIAAVQLADAADVAAGYAWAPPTLVVCPLAVLPQWVDEIRAHTTLDVARQVVSYHGDERTRRAVTVAALQRADVRFVLTTYEMVRIERGAAGLLHRTTWRRIILDEADRIRSMTSATSQAVRALKSPRRFCLTGTPINNAKSDVHALAAFIDVPPYNAPQWWAGATSDAEQSWRREFMLRRLKSVLTLPPMMSERTYLPLSADERRVYSALESEAVLYFSAAHHHHGGNGGGDDDERKLDIRQVQRLLEWLLRLRQAACHPMLAYASSASKAASAAGRGGCAGCGRARPPPEVPLLRAWGTGRACSTHAMCGACAADTATECRACVASQNQQRCAALASLRSAKQTALVDALRRHLRDDATAKAIVFSQWTSFLDLVQADLQRHGLRTLRIDGGVKSARRAEICREFRDDEGKDAARVLVSTVKAGGVGLNLARANLVVMLDGWYNPACEAQAVDRVYRIGQTRPVRVLRLRTDTLVERVIDAIQDDKLRVAGEFLRDEPAGNGRGHGPEDAMGSARPPTASGPDDDDEAPPSMSMLTQIFRMIVAGRRQPTSSLPSAAALSSSHSSSSSSSPPLAAPTMTASLLATTDEA